MKAKARIIVIMLFGSGGACDSSSGKAVRDGAIDTGTQTGGQVGSTSSAGGATSSGGGGVTINGTGSSIVVGTGGAVFPPTSAGGTGGNSLGSGGSVGPDAGSGEAGTPIDAATLVADAGRDGKTSVDGGQDATLSTCEKNGKDCVSLNAGCAVCPQGSHAESSNYGCPAGSWCCTQTAPGKSLCEQQGGICGSSGPSCPPGWTAMRTECSSSTSTCCSPQGKECKAVAPAGP
jgi:hypothetical protein